MKPNPNPDPNPTQVAVYKMKTQDLTKQQTVLLYDALADFYLAKQEEWLIANQVT